MKRVLLLFVVTLCSSVVMAQSVLVVDSEKIFRSQPDYAVALSQVDALSKGYQAQVDAKFAEVESSFNQYAASQSQYSASVRQQVEAAILFQEQQATKFQEECFGEDGLVMKKRLELIAPIQTRVFGAIEAYAKMKGSDVVLDRASNPTLLYVRYGVDCTEEIIQMLR